MRLAALVLFAAGVALGFDLTWWLTHDHCHTGVRCIHVWHHVLFAGLYLLAAALAWSRIRRR